MTYSETIILPEVFYELFTQSEVPQNFENFGNFGSEACLEPIGINKPEGIPDLLPYQPKRAPLNRSTDASSQNNFQPTQNYQRGGRGKQPFQKGGRRQQGPYQPNQKKIVSSVEVSPEFANRNLATWGKPKTSPPMTEVPTMSSFQSESIKLGTSFNPEKAPSVTNHASEPIHYHSSSSSFNPEAISSSSDAPPVQQHEAPKQAPTPALAPEKVHAAPQPAASKQTPTISAWGNTKSKPKPQSFAELLQSEESAKPAPRSPQAPHSFNPSSIAKKEIRPFQPAPADDVNWPSLASLDKNKK